MIATGSRCSSDPAVAGLSAQARRSYARVEISGNGAGEQPIGLGNDPVERVEPDYFVLYGMPMLAGRAFVEADAGTSAVIVNQLFAERLHGAAVLGRGLRFLHESEDAEQVEAGPWLTIVGVVDDFERHAYEGSERIYLAANAAQLVSPIDLVMRVRMDPPIGFGPRLRQIAAAVDPMLQIDDIVSLADRRRQQRRFMRLFALGCAAVMLSVLLLSAAGVYAMMSFTVARRRREIGIRSALGASPRRVLSGIFARACVQLAVGILLGLLGSFAVDRLAGRGPVNDGNVSALLLVAVAMTAFGLLSAMDPARRALAVQPTEALRE